MAQLKTRPRKTLEDYFNLPDEVRAELIEGEILMSPSPTPRHQVLVYRLHHLLEDYLKPRGSGQIYGAPLDVVLPSGDVVQPDIIFISTSRRSIVRDRIRGVPDLLIEVLSPEGIARDRILKRALYARNGVREYWIADDEAKGVEVLKRSGSELVPHGYFEIGDTLRSPVLAGLSLPVRSIFETA
ncbi:MAG: Uma2 family endonuclease [Planctomycetes bacterium]|nr:Uma2 family endonuclease [Planctomycetota bacterium]